MNKKWIIAFLLLFIIFNAYLIYDGVESYRHYRSNERMAELLQDQGSEDNTEGGELQILPKYSAIYEKNNEFAGWIKIPGTMVDYPVMMPKEDNNFYLNHSPEGEKSKYGSIYLDVDTDLANRKGNYLLYGHYFRDGNMFGTLEHYKEEGYWKEHPNIQFDTIYEEGNYEIIAVFLSQVYRKNEDAFKYYQYVDITSKEEFERYVSHIKEQSLYDTGKTAQYGDSLITLSTCDYWTENGRLAVVARKIKNQ